MYKLKLWQDHASVKSYGVVSSVVKSVLLKRRFTLANDQEYIWEQMQIEKQSNQNTFALYMRLKMYVGIKYVSLSLMGSPVILP